MPFHLLLCSPLSWKTLPSFSQISYALLIVTSIMIGTSMLMMLMIKSDLSKNIYVYVVVTKPRKDANFK